MKKKKAKKFIVVVMALIKRGDKILMTLRNEKENPGAHLKWELPGGKIDFGERPETTLIREVGEETGYPIKVIDLFPVIHTKVWEYPNFLQHTLLLSFRCRIVGKQKPFKDKKVKEVAWRKIKEIDYSKTLPATKEVIEKLARKK